MFRRSQQTAARRSPTVVRATTEVSGAFRRRATTRDGSVARATTVAAAPLRASRVTPLLNARAIMRASASQLPAHRLKSSAAPFPTAVAGQTYSAAPLAQPVNRVAPESAKRRRALPLRHVARVSADPFPTVAPACSHAAVVRRLNHVVALVSLTSVAAPRRPARMPAAVAIVEASPTVAVAPSTAASVRRVQGATRQARVPLRHAFRGTRVRRRGTAVAPLSMTVASSKRAVRPSTTRPAPCARPRRRRAPGIRTRICAPALTTGRANPRRTRGSPLNGIVCPRTRRSPAATAVRKSTEARG